MVSTRTRRTSDATRAEDHQREVRFGRGLYPTAIRVMAWLCFVGLFVAWVWVLKPPPVRTTHPDLARISELTGLQFPTEARLLDSEMRQQRGFHLRAQVEVRRTGLPTFLRSVPQSLDESRSEAVWLPDEMEGGTSDPWLPSSSSFVTYGGNASHKGRRAQVVIFITLHQPRIAGIWIDWKAR